MIPSLKTKLFQTSIGNAPQTSKSGNRTNAITGATGLTYDEKLLIPNSALGDINMGGAYSRTGGRGSISNMNVPSVGALLTSPTA